MPATNLNGGLKEKYKSQIRPNLKQALAKKNIFEVAALEKIVLNTSFGKIEGGEKVKEQVAERLATISGQKPVFTAAKKAIAGFKIRKGQIIGAKATLRRDRMYHFFEKLVRIVLPRLRDFRGVSENFFDDQGNYTIGFREIGVFPEIDYVREEKPIGLEVTIKTRAKNKEEAKALLAELGMPFAKFKAKKEEAKVNLP